MSSARRAPAEAGSRSGRWWHELPLVVLLAAGVALGHVLGYSAAGVVHPDGHLHLDHAFPYLTSGALVAIIVLVGRLAQFGVAVRPSSRRFVAAHVVSYLILEFGEHLASNGGQVLLSRQVAFGLVAQVLVAVAARRLVIVAGGALSRLSAPLGLGNLPRPRRHSGLVPTSRYVPTPSTFSTSRVSRGPPIGSVTAIT